MSKTNGTESAREHSLFSWLVFVCQSIRKTSPEAEAGDLLSHLHGWFQAHQQLPFSEKRRRDEGPGS